MSGGFKCQMCGWCCSHLVDSDWSGLSLFPWEKHMFPQKRVQPHLGYGVSPKDEDFKVFLYHYPGLIYTLADRGIDLHCAGHTHGGQVRIPGFGSIVVETKLGRRYMEGLNDYKGMKTFVSRGIGAGKFLMPRVACRPEAIWFEISN